MNTETLRKPAPNLVTLVTYWAFRTWLAMILLGVVSSWVAIPALALGFGQTFVLIMLARLLVMKYDASALGA